MSSVYSLLARLWIAEIDATLLASLCCGELAEAWREAGGRLPAADSKETRERLAVDYCSLFVGPRGHLPPVQSAWEIGEFEGQAAESMRRYLELVPCRRFTRQAENLPDHLAVQLDVMGTIARELESSLPPPDVFAKEKPTDVDSALRSLAGSFFHDHLLWPYRLFETAAARASTDFYRGLIRVTSGFLQTEKAQWAKN